MKTIYFVVCLLGALFPMMVPAADLPPNRHTPETAQLREEIIATAEKLNKGHILNWAEFQQDGRRLFVLSYCPFSGRSAVYVHLYYHDGRQWIRFLEQVIDGPHMITAELPLNKNVLVLRGNKGAVVLTERLDNIKRK